MERGTDYNRIIQVRISESDSSSFAGLASEAALLKLKPASNTETALTSFIEKKEPSFRALPEWGGV